MLRNLVPAITVSACVALTTLPAAAGEAVGAKTTKDGAIASIPQGTLAAVTAAVETDGRDGFARTFDAAVDAALAARPETAKDQVAADVASWVSMHSDAPQAVALTLGERYPGAMEGYAQRMFTAQPGRAARLLAELVTAPQLTGEAQASLVRGLRAVDQATLANARSSSRNQSTTATGTEAGQGVATQSASLEAPASFDASAAFSPGQSFREFLNDPDTTSEDVTNRLQSLSDPETNQTEENETTVTEVNDDGEVTSPVVE